MSYAVRKDGKGWRAVNSIDDVMPDETFSVTQPEIIINTIPQVVSRFQGRAALANSGHFTTVNNYMASLPVDNLQRLAWEDAQEFRRNSPTVAAMQTLLGLSDAEIDDLFIDAATIEA